MSDTPISSFLFRQKTYHVHDMAILFQLLGMQERNDLISPAVSDRALFPLDGITSDEYRTAFKRLVEAKELVYNEDDTQRGYFVRRYWELMEGLEDVGKRAYFRRKRKEAMERKKDEVAV